MKSILRRLTNRLNCKAASPNKTKAVEFENLEPRLLFSAAPVDAPAENAEAPGNEVSTADVQVDAQSAQASAEALTETESASEVGAVARQAPLPAPGESSITVNQGVTLLDLSPAASTLNQETLDAVAEAAADRWRATGLSEAQSAALDAIDYNVGSLSNFQLGIAEDNSITLDDNAGGAGWFIDSTPLDDEEYTLGDGGVLSATSGEASYGKDLLTVLMHEQGHVLGLDHEHESELDPADIMASTIGAGERRLPGEGQAAGHDPGSLEGTHFIVPFNNSDSVAGDTTTTLSSFTVNAGDDRLLVVFVAEENTGTFTDVTFNGGSLTRLGGVLHQFTQVDVWYTHLGAGTGAAITSDIVFTNANTGGDGLFSVVSAVAYDGVNSATPVEGLMTSTAGTTTTVTSEVGDLVVGAAYNADNALGVSGAQVAIETNNNIGGFGFPNFMSSQETGAASVTMSYTGTTGGEAEISSVAFNINALVAGGGSPEITVEHDPNNDEIADGETAVSGILDEGTRFESVVTSAGSEVRTFLIRNDGTADLTLSGQPTLSTDTHFSISTLSGGGLVLGAGETRTFTVTFDPSVDGIHTDTVNIASNDGDEAAYDFLVSGIGKSGAASTVTQLGTELITAGDDADTIASFTVDAGANRLLVVYAFTEEADHITDVTFNGGSLTFGGTGVSGASGTAGERIEIWYETLGTGAAVSGPIVMTAHGGASDSEASAVAAVVYQNVDQTTPVDGFNSATGNGADAAHDESVFNVTSEDGDLVVTAHYNSSVNDGTTPADPTHGAGQTELHDPGALVSGGTYFVTGSEPGSLVVDAIHSWDSAPDASQAFLTVGLNLNAAPPSPDIDWDDNTASVPAGATVTVEDAGTPANNDTGAANTIAFQDRVVNHNNTASSTLSINLQAVGTADSFSLAAGGANAASVTFSPGSGGPISGPATATITGLGFNASIDDTAGAKSATVTSTDGNTAAADDIDDVLNLSTNVFDPANASFSAGSDLNTTTIDFGTQAADSGTYTDTWAITNREGLNNFTLDLDFVSIADDGDPGPFNPNSLALALFGDQQEDITSGNYTALFNSAGLAAGVYTENFTLTFATDDASEGNNVLGVGGTQTLTLTLTAVVTAAGPPATEESDVSVSGGNLIITDVLGGDTDDDLTISTNGTSLTIVDNNGNGIDLGAVTGTGDGTDTVTINLGDSGWTGGIVWDSLGGDDILRIDFSSGDFTRTIDFDGGGNGALGDELFLFGGGTFDAAIYNFTNENDGNITLIQNATISYTGLEPITSTLTVTNASLVYSGVDETIAVSAAGVGTTRVDSTAGEAVTFTNPTGALNIYAGDGNDTINVNGFGTGFGAALTIDGQGGSDLINYRADGITLGAGNAATFDAERIDFLLGDLTTSDGNITARGTGGSGGSFIGVRLIGSDLNTGSGAITLTGSGGDTGISNQGVQISSGSSLLTGGGSIDIDGSGGGTGANNHGVFVAGSSLSTGTSGSGTIDIDGTSSTGGTSSNHGVFFATGTTASVFNGAMTIQGTGDGSLGLNNGINAINATLTSSGSGSITGTGTSNGSSSNNQGIVLVNTTIESTGGSGSITLDGTGSSSGLSNNEGVKVSNTDLTTDGGSIDIDGLGGGTTGFNNTGVTLVNGSSAEAAGSGNVTIDGDSGSGSLFNRGVYATGGIVLSTVNGDLTVRGTGNGTISFNRGVEFSSTTAKATGSGSVTIEGTGSISASGLFNTGVYLLSSTVSANNGNITMTGNGGSGSSYNEGVRIQSSSVTTGGITDIIGNANLGTSGSSNTGVYIYLNSTVNGNGSSSIDGLGGGGSSSNHGVVMNVGITSNIPCGSINGTATSGDDEFGNFFPC